jgi:hypothetical protein
MNAPNRMRCGAQVQSESFRYIASPRRIPQFFAQLFALHQNWHSVCTAAEARGSTARVRLVSGRNTRLEIGPCAPRALGEPLQLS